MTQTILIIEDKEELKENTAKVLEIAGYKILKADSGKDGIRIAEKELPDVIICGISTIGMDGYSVLYLIGKKAELSTIPFILLDWGSNSIDIRKAFALGADDYLIAPFSNLDLLNSVECQLKKRENQRAFYSKSYKKIYGFGENDGKMEIKKTIAGRKVKKVKAKYPVYTEGDPASGIYLLLEGRVKSLKLNEDGRELVTGVYGPNEYFGVHDLLVNDFFTETVEAIDDSTVCLVPKDTVIDLIGKYPDLAKEFIRILSVDVIQKKEQLLQLAYHSVRKRMAETLLNLGRKWQRADSLSRLLVDIPREDLAGIAGVAIETVCRTLTDFQNEGILAKEGLKLHLLNIPKLEKMRN